MIAYYYKSIHDKSFKKIEGYRAGCWVNVEEATSEDLVKIAELTGLDYYDLHDSLDQYEIPRVERQESLTILFVRNPSDQSTDLHTEILTVIISDKYLITISTHKNQVINVLLDQINKLTTTQISKFLINILLKIAQRFTINVKEVRNKVVKRKRNLKQIADDDFIHLAENEEILNQYLSALIPMNNVFEAIISGRYITIYEEDKDLLQDLLISVKQSVDICNVNLKSITSLRESYQVIFTNNLNKIIKLLTSLTIILTIPTMIASFYGMNVRLPFDDNPFAYLIILNVILISSVGAIVIFYWKKWL